jgi:cardiolipin synthase
MERVGDDSAMHRLKRLGIVLGGLVVVALALAGFLSITRGTPIDIVLSQGAEAPPAVDDSLFERTFELYTGTHVFSGNVVEPALNGNGTYPRLWEDLRGAQETITVQMYYSIPGKVADTLAAILAERGRGGVRVLLMLDAFGSQKLSKEWVQGLRDAGVRVAILRKLKWYQFHNATGRSHVRVVVVDGRIAYTGGFGLADYWLGDGVSEGQWRESNVRFEGPAVMALQAAFATAWAEATGELLTGPLFYPLSGFAERGTVHAGLLFTRPTSGSTAGERFLALSIAAARRTLYIANSYFVPDDDLRRLLIAAARRGVDVRILTVSEKTDVKTTWYAGRYRYEELLRGGVRIYEYLPTMMHSKTMVADGLWSTIGSMNFDNRSLAFNDESNLVFLDPTLGAQMDSTFLGDLRHSREVTLASLAHRSIWERALEVGAAMLQRLL